MTRIGLLDKFIKNVMGDNVAFNVRVHLARVAQPLAIVNTSRW